MGATGVLHFCDMCRATFHRSQMEKARNVEGKQTDHGWNRLAGVAMQTFNVVILVALVARNGRSLSS